MQDIFFKIRKHKVITRMDYSNDSKQCFPNIPNLLIKVRNRINGWYFLVMSKLVLIEQANSYKYIYVCHLCTHNAYYAFLYFYIIVKNATLTFVMLLDRCDLSQIGKTSLTSSVCVCIYVYMYVHMYAGAYSGFFQI